MLCIIGPSPPFQSRDHCYHTENLMTGPLPTTTALDTGNTTPRVFHWSCKNIMPILFFTVTALSLVVSSPYLLTEVRKQPAAGGVKKLDAYIYTSLQSCTPYLKKSFCFIYMLVCIKPTSRLCCLCDIFSKIWY